MKMKGSGSLSLCFDMLISLEATGVGTALEAELPSIFICAV